MFSVWPCPLLSEWAQMNLWRCSSTPGRMKNGQLNPVTQSLARYWRLCWDWCLPENVRAQAKFCGGIQAGTWRWTPAGSTLLWACPGPLRPASGRAPGFRGPCLGASGAGPGAGQVEPGDRCLLGWTDPCWRGIHAIQMRSPHPPAFQRASAVKRDASKSSYGNGLLDAAAGLTRRKIA